MKVAREFSIEAMVCRYHIYEDIWDATVGEEQPCQRESDIINRHRHQETAGHTPFYFTKRFSTLFTPALAKKYGGQQYFLRQGTSRIW